MTVRNYRDLLAWQKAMDLVVAVYTTTAEWPKSEMFGLVRQAREAAVSVACNVAEGKGRRADGELRRFLGIAHGSLCEVETCLLLAQRLRYLSGSEAERLLTSASEVGKLVTGLANAIPPKEAR